jgi:hypothetical protein
MLRHTVAFMQTNVNLTLAKAIAWTFAILLLGFTLWTRTYIPQRYVLISLGGLFLGGVVFDLKPGLWGKDTAIRDIIPAVLCMACLLPMLWFLYEAWEHEFVTWWSAGPLLPYSDAAGYLNGAKCLLTFGQLGEYGSFRPMGTFLFAFVLGITNQNYQSALILLAILAGLATYFAVRETWFAGGLAAALLYLCFCQLVIFEWLPIFMTETPGYIFASTSYAFLLRGFRQRSFGNALLGLGFLIIALTARAGAMFAIPFLGIYLIYFFSRGRADAIGKSLAVAAVVGLFMASAPLLLLRIGPSEAQYQGPLAYTLYGIAAGGKGWDYIFQEHPELWQIASNGERTRYAYSLFWERVNADPTTFFATLFDAFLFALEKAAPVFYGLVKFLPSLVPAILALLAFIFLVPSTLKRQGPWAFLPPVAIAILLSSPFLFDSGFRIYMATIPFHLGLAANAVALLFDRIRTVRSRSRNFAASGMEVVEQRDTKSISPSWEWSLTGFAILLLAAVSLFPLAASLRGNSIFNRLRNPSTVSQDEVIIHYNPGSGTLIEEKSPVPGVMSTSFQAIMRSPYFAPHLSLQRHMVSGDYLYHALFLPNRADKAYILFDRLPDLRPGYLRVKIRLLENQKEAFLYRAESFVRFDL